MRNWLAILAVVAIAWWWHRDSDPREAAPALTLSTASKTTRAGLGELIAHLPTPAQMKLRPFYIFEGELRLEGQTVDADKRPIGGVTVTLNGKRTVTSEADGSFAFDQLAEGDYTLAAEKGLLYAEDAPTLYAEMDPVELEMKVGVGMAFHVETAAHAPIRDAALEIGTRTTLTDADGNASVRGLDLDGENLTVTAAGYAPQDVHLETGDDPSAKLARTIVLEPGAPFGGTVVDQDGKPVAEATVMLAQARWRGRVDADAKGHFEVPFLAAGKVIASAYSAETNSNPDETYGNDGLHAKRDAVVHVTTGARATGIVVDGNGVPLAGAMVMIGNASDQSDEHGAFALKGIVPGTVDVRAWSDTMGIATRQVEIRAGSPLVLRLELVASTISGTVRDARGEPIEGASISAAGKNDIGHGYVRSDEHGTFDFGGLPPGDYDVSATAEKDSGSTPPGVMVHTGTHNLALTVKDLGGIAGRVVENGVSVTYFGVGSSDDPDPSYIHPDAVRSVDGAFSLPNLRAGLYTVVVVGAFERTLVKNVRVTEGAITQLGNVTVAEGRIVRGVVHDERGTPIAGAVVSVASSESYLGDDSIGGKASGSRTARSDANGTFEVAGLENDSLYVEATRDHDMSARQVLTAETNTVDITIAQAGSLDGTINHHRGRRAHVTLTALTEESDAASYKADVDGVGNFAFERVPPGAYRLDLSGETVTKSQTVRVDAGATTAVTIDVPANPIAVAIRSPGCKAITLRTEDSFQGHENCHDGVATFADVSPGTYRACIEYIHCGPVTVAASPNQQAAVLTLEVEPTAADPAPEVAPDPPPPTEPEPAPEVEATEDP